MARLRSVGKLISGLADAMGGIVPKKSGVQRRKPTQQMRDLNKRIKKAMADNNLEAVDVEAEWKSALQKIKQQLQNQIEDLDKQIENKERRKVRRSAIQLDQEAKGLKALRDEKRAVLDGLVGKPTLTVEQKISRAEKALERSIEALEGEIESGDMAYKTNASLEFSS